MSKTVEEKILDYYCAEGGEWLIEKGKVKEARLLKEAYHRIISLKKDLDMYGSWLNNERLKNIEKERSWAERERSVELMEKKIEQKLIDLRELLGVKDYE